MKKLLLFCLLSVFMSMGYIANAQSPVPECCFWLENADPDRPEDQYSLNPMATSQGEDQYYYFRFDNTCGLDPFSKISIDWQISINGQPIDALNATLLGIEIETKNPLANFTNNDGYITSGQLLSGQGFSSALSCPNKTDYPGGLGGPYPNSYCANTPMFSYFSLGANNLYNFYYVHFLQYASDNNLIRLKINRKSWAVDFKITVKLIERINGEAYENPYSENPTRYIGGKLATRGAELASFTLTEQTYLTDTESACSGTPILVGIDPDGDPYSYVMNPTIPDPVAEMIVDVPFYSQTWNCADYIDSVVTYTMTWAPVPGVPNIENQTRCGAGTLTFTGKHPLDTQYPGVYSLTYKWYSSNVISPANLLYTGNTYTTPVLPENNGIQLWVTASISGCEGPAQLVEGMVFKQPSLTLTNPSDLCPVAGNKTVTASVGNIYMEESSCNLSIVWTGATSATANCTTFTASVPVTDECNASYPYSAVLTDNVSACTVTANNSFTLVDEIAPTFTAPAEFTAFKEANCALDISSETTGTPSNIQDNCSDPNFVISSNDVITPGSCSDNYTITRTWSVADHCGNATTHNQTILVRDIIAPTFTVPAPITIYKNSTCGYDANVLITGDVTDEADNCTTGLNAVFTDAVAPGSCTGQQIITRTWTLTDACLNVTTKTQIITAIDTTKPTFTVPGPVTIYKDASCGYNANVTITGDVTDEADNCSTGLNAVFTDAVAPGSCQGQQIITRTWTLTDACNNVTSKTQIITAIDTTKPTFTVPGPFTIYKDATCGYNANVSITGDVTNEADNCSTGIQAVFTDAVAAGTCQGQQIITRTWTLTDYCGNTTTKTQIITAIDTTRPTFTVPGPVTIYKDASCAYNASVSITGDVTDEADNCSTGLNAVFSDVVTAGSCQGQQIITRTWTLTDACNNVTTKTQIITAIDTTKPTFTVPGPVTIYKDASCGYNANVAITGDVTDETDNCSTGLNAVFSDVVTAGNCQGQQIITRTWTLTDHCGNTTTKTQIITAIDTTKPTFTVPGPFTIYKDASCGYNANVSITGDVTDEADNCSTGLNAVYTDAVAAGTCQGQEIITRTWTLTDACGNTTTKVQIITALDNTKPTFTAPADLTIYKNATCGYDATITVTGDVTNEADNCSTGLQAVFTDTEAVGTCPNDLIITRTWTLTDDCNNTTTHVQIITVEDNTAPTFTVPANITIYKDAMCNHDASVAFTGDVTDEADNCATGIQATYNDVYTSGACPTSNPYITRTWTLTDNCGNSTSHVQIITITDNIKPTFTVPADIAICKTPSNTYDAATTITGNVTDHADNCTAQANLVVNYSDVVTLGTATEAGSIVRTWTVTDACLNTETKVQTITLNPAPVATMAVSPTPDFCLPETGEETITATLTAVTVGSYTYQITLPNSNVVNAATATYNVSTPNTYTFSGYVVNTTTNCASAVSSASTIALLHPEFEITLINNKRGCRDDVPSLNGSFSVSNYENYTFSISPNVGSYADGVFSNLPIGIYQVTAEHVNGCSITKTQEIVFSDAYTPVALFELNGADEDVAICWTSGIFLSTLVTDLNNVPAHQYNYHIIVPTNVTTDGSNGIRIYAPGIYAIGGVIENVTTGCRDTSWHYVYANEYPTVSVTADPFCLNDDVTLTATPGSSLVAPHYYSYEWESANTTGTLGTEATLTHTTLVTNTYTVDLTANYTYNGFDVFNNPLTFNLACTTPGNLEVTPRPLPVFEAQESASKRVCNAADPGAITIGNGWDETNTWTLTRVATGDVTTILTPTFNVPDSGYYSITATSPYGCEYSRVVFVDEDSIGFNAVLHADESALVSGVDKSADLTFCWDNSSQIIYHEVRYTNIPTFSYQYTINTPENISQQTSQYSYVLASGSYMLSGYVTNLTTGCKSKVDTLMVYAVPTPVYTISDDETICRGESITVGITPTSTFSTVWAYGPTTGDQLEITPAMYGTAPSFTANVTVTANLTGASFGCSETDQVVITINDHPSIAEPTVVDVKCNGGTDGSINVTVSGTAPLSFAWADLGTFTSEDEDLTNIPAGTYSLTVTDGIGCTSTLLGVLVEQPEILVATATQEQPVSCFGGNNGIALASATGGTGPYTYTWPQGGHNIDTTGLLAGVYTVTVTDTKGCIATASVTITEPTAVQITSATITDAIDCNGGYAEVTIVATGGTGLHTYSFNSTNNTTGVFANVLAGTDLVYSVVDANGCGPVTGTITITQPTAVQITSATITDAIDCNGGYAEVTIVATGGTGLHTYSFNSTNNTTGVFANVLAGTDLVYSVVDANGCGPVTGTITITQPTAVQITSATITDAIDCNGGYAEVTIVATGGTGLHTYSFNSTNNTTGVFANVLAGTDLVYSVVDANGCGPVTGTITITQPTAVQITSATITDAIDCNGGYAEVTIVATGGTGLHTYSFNSTNNTTGVFANVLAGTDLVYSVVDANGCGPVTGTITITQPTAVQITSATITDAIDCNGGYAEVTIVATGGTGLHTYSFNSTNNTTGVFANVLAGTDLVYSVVDANGCGPVTGTITITQPTAVQITSATITDAIDCNGGYAEVTIVATGGTGLHTYSFNSTNNTTGVFANVLAGTDLVYSVVDANGCGPVTGTITITQPTAVQITSATITDAIDCNGGYAEVTIVATGGTGLHTYSFNSTNNTTGVFANVLAGTDLVYSVVDANGCGPVTGTITITQPTAVQITSATITDAIDCNGGYAEVTIVATGGTGLHTYSFNSTNNTTGVFANVLAGTDLVYSVVDANGCGPVTGTITITQPTAVQITSATITDAIDCNGGYAEVTIVATGGTGLHTYSFNSTNNTTGVFANVLAGTDLVYSVVDANGCGPVTGTITITQPTAVQITSATITDAIDCNGGYAEVTIVATGGTGLHTYSFNSTNNTTGVFANVLAGTDLVYSVVDANGCGPVTGTITITQPTAVQITSATITDAIDCNGGYAEVTIVATGGTGLHTYSFNSTNNTTGVFANVLAGTDLVYSVVDANGCGPVTGTITITQPTAVQITSATITDAIDCNGGYAEVTIVATGGTGLHTYSFNSTNNTTGVFANVLAGTDLVYSVVDANGCGPVTGTITITQPAAALSATTSVTDVKCFGGSDGSATVDVTGGTIGTGYQYSWNTDPVQNTQTAIGLSVDSYIVIVTDANGCTTSATALVQQPTAITASISTTNTICMGSTTNVNLTASGGTTPLTFLWSNDETTKDLTGVAAGTYTVTVTDNLGCAATASTTISYYDIPTITTNEPAQVCLATSFTVTATSTHAGTWSAQAYDATTDAAIGSPVASSDYTYSSATTDTIYIVYTFTSTTGGCTYTDTTNDIKISGEPYLNVYKTSPLLADNYTTIGVDEPVTFHFRVDNTCNFNDSTRLSVMYTIKKDGNVINDITPFVSNANSIRYQMDLSSTGIESYYSPFNYTSSLSVAPAAHFPLATPSGATLGSYQFDFFSLAYFDNREGTISISNFIQPGVYTIEYALITNYKDAAMLIPNGNEIGVLTTLDPQRLGGNQFYTGTYYTKVWSTNTMTITVSGDPVLPTPPQPSITEKPIRPEPAMRVYPNPSVPSQTIYVEVENIVGEAVLSVSSVSGSIIDKSMVTISENQKQFVYNLKDVVPGIYFVTLTSKDAVLTKKIIIQPR